MGRCFVRWLIPLLPSLLIPCPFPAFAAFPAPSLHSTAVLCLSINNASPTFPGNFARALEEFDTNDDGQIDFDEFREVRIS